MHLSVFRFLSVLGLLSGTRACREIGLGKLAPEITGQDQQFDFVVVGGGTAGIAIAARLAEDSSVTVALVEAGTFYELNNAPISSTPFADILGLGADNSEIDPAIDWGIMTTPQAAANLRPLHYARARNFMIYQRPTKQSLQMWADEVDDQSYSWENFIPYFKKSVKFTPPNSQLRAANASVQYEPSAFEPEGGPLHVTYPNYAQPFASYMEGGFNEIGINTTKDFNSGSLLGAQWTAASINPNGAIRSSSEEAFLSASVNRTNFKVFDSTMAKKILFDDAKNAVGVEVNVTGYPPFTLKASKEIIVSAGAFQSPQMLMVSGVGPKGTLEKLGIDVIVDNPNVGQNMWDHVFAGPGYSIAVDSITRMINDPEYQMAAFVEYQQTESGPFSSNNADYVAWEKIPHDLRQTFPATVLENLEYFPPDWPEIEYVVCPGYIGDFTAPGQKQPNIGNYASIGAAVVSPLSRGSITIASADTNDLPIVDPNFLAHPSDRALIVAGYKRVRQLFASSVVKEIVIGDEFYPGLQYATDEEVYEQIKQSLMPVWHAAGTCKMGRPDDPKAVIDTQARVLGVQRLRVVDASSFPLLPPGHPQSVIYALAEKIAEDIKSSHCTNPNYLDSAEAVLQR
ncbi:hypothetical protein D9757_004364 [Collybiopsis confluens]|uniref:Glucose-methanol-choline oxidoreductase N-terminal domain-containing protein n=1 Tax=Collybiopsis confluens TaxID=2823264 RepID=A0A8H5MCW2_9AGAR|nr:hypothetical protein D9757_004364 [Collybiopsis confluens]